jgi:hypothetical protein
MKLLTMPSRVVKGRAVRPLSDAKAQLLLTGKYATKARLFSGRVVATFREGGAHFVIFRRNKR